MKPKLRPQWNVTPREAMRLQEVWRERVETQDRFGPLHYVAGADVAFDPETNVAFAGVIVYRLPGLEEVERRMARRKLRPTPDQELYALPCYGSRCGPVKMHRLRYTSVPLPCCCRPFAPALADPAFTMLQRHYTNSQRQA